ncbi:MAG: nucleotidyltransferase family protein [Crocosphaera sp.]
MKHLTELEKEEIITKVVAAQLDQKQFSLNMKEKQKQGFKIAKKCANFLQNKYGVTKVVLFGSLLNYEEMNKDSDIDLAVWNLSEKEYFNAVGFLLEISEDFSIDLVEAEKAKTYILDAINQGLEL